MRSSPGAPNPVFDLSDRVSVLPVVHGAAVFARQVRQRLRQEAGGPWDCLAVCLPPSFADEVEEGIARLPRVSVVVQEELRPGQEDDGGASFVPIDPCQPVIEAIRCAVAADVTRAWVDLEVDVWQPPEDLLLPDAYPLPETGWEAFAAACLPVLPAPAPGSQRQERLHHMAARLRQLATLHRRVLFVCSLADWPWVRLAWSEGGEVPDPFGAPAMARRIHLDEESLYFVLGELPYLTHLHEHRRAEELAGVADLAEGIDGIKALLIEARDRLRAEEDASPPTSQRLRILLQYVRNRTLMERRMTPQLFDLVRAAQQVVGDAYALKVIETARQYPAQRIGPDAGAGQPFDARGGEPDDDGVHRDRRNRLEGQPRVWRDVHLRPEPPLPEKQRWRMEWDPFGQCSWPPEDTRIENFQQHVREHARALLGLDEPKVERFSASLKDGLDLRETLRNWHTGDLYVREMPPSRGSIEVVVMLFHVPAPPDIYTWRSTWYAEHEEESTLCFFATPHEEGLVGPGIGQAVYGGCMFLFPPRPIPDVWSDPRLQGFRRLEERLLAAACFHSRQRRVVVVAPSAPPAAWRRLARGFRRQLVYLPLTRFSAETVDRLRHFHVLNGRHVRSYAARYIRPPR
jgi:hypothetical protein